jgi:hypothetical protein
MDDMSDSETLSAASIDDANALARGVKKDSSLHGAETGEP